MAPIDQMSCFYDSRYGEKEPEIQTINFISKKDTSKVRDFTLYLYKYTSSGTSNKNSPSHINSYDWGVPLVITNFC